MSICFHRDEKFRIPFHFSNSDAALLRFPFPFPEDSYTYSVNIEPHTRGGPTEAFSAQFDVDEHYIAECQDRAELLAAEPSRCTVLPHMHDAEWDALELIMSDMAKDYPDLFTLTRDGDQWTWHNRPLGLQDTFTFGNASTLPCGPFEYITRQAQGDFTLQDQRDGNLFLDGVTVTGAADYSPAFDLGMSFDEWHGPATVATEMGIFDRALQYLLKLQVGRPVRRLNWTLTVNPRFDTSAENYPVWGPDRTTITPDNIGNSLFLRVELQSLYRLPRSNAILFNIRTYFASFGDLCRVPKWGRRLHRVFRDLPPELAAYKGLVRFLPTAVTYLAAFDDGSPTSPGIAPDIQSLRPVGCPA